MSDQDTICSVSTPAGAGGIGIIRVSGSAALSIASTVFRPRKAADIMTARSHSLHFGHVVDPVSNDIVDEALVSVMRAPATYTREDVVEINCHGGMMPLWRTMNLLIAAGARQAEPGEFTKRAFLNGRIDLAQAEAVMDIITAKTDLALRAANEQLLGGLSGEVAVLRDRLLSIVAAVETAIDFPEEEIESGTGQPIEDEIGRVLAGVDSLLSGFTYGRILRDGFATAIVGKPNVGKSSLLNALVRRDRAIVAEMPGTTRDVIEEYLNIAGVPIKILDTAGIRHSHDTVEQEGVRRSMAAIDSADIALLVLDCSRQLTDEDRHVMHELRGKQVLAIINKSDLPRKLERLEWPDTQVSVSCRTGSGLENLNSAISGLVRQGMVGPREHTWAVNQRHKTALEKTIDDLQKALESVSAGLSPEFIALDLRGALDGLGLIIGATYTEDILERIFNDFCIGK